MKSKRQADGVPVRKSSKVDGDEKLCLLCGEMKPLFSFSPTSRGLGGVAAYCKPCFSSHYGQSDEVAKKATAEYRERHRERWRANHRIHMFERRTKMTASKDGTVTDKFLRDLYSEKYCHYCLQYTEPGQRTADHVVALNNGGAHSASNLVMACFTCNSSKRDLTEDEFMNRGLK